MLTRSFTSRHDPQLNMRLDTLVRLRWFAAAGQVAAVLAVHYGLDFTLPIEACLTTIGLSAWLNVVLGLRGAMSPRIGPNQEAGLLAFDIAQLAALLFLTGGLQNPFAYLLLGPVLIAAVGLPPRTTLALGLFAVLCATALVFIHYPLPWASDDPLELPPIYMAGVWLSMLLALGFISVYAWQIAEGSRRLGDALAATELVLAREQHLSQLDGLAAAAAHELATPLATITLVAKELERALEPASPHGEDVRLLREQAQRCREILGKLTQLSTEGAPFDSAPLSALLHEVAAPHRNFGIEIDLVLPPERRGEPVGGRVPALLYGLGNLVENAVDFARERVEIAARWTEREVAVTIADDGPGFAPEIIDRLGEPYTTTRAARRKNRDAARSRADQARADGRDLHGGAMQSLAQDEPTGLGLGFFIAKTLLERSGATLAFANRAAPEHGAVVRVRWARADFEASAPAPRAPEVA